MLQVGALRALLEANIRPRLWAGVSAGAINAAFLAVHGFNAAGMDKLEIAWEDAGKADLLPRSYLWLTARVFFNRVGMHPYHHRMRAFFMAHGLSPGLRFGDLTGPRLLLVATDLSQYSAVVYGLDPAESVLEALLASTAIPPWIRPLRIGDRLLADGGIVSNLPLEAAINAGASEIIALHIDALQRFDPDTTGFGPFFLRLMDTIEQRQFDLELALAQAKNVPVHRIALKTDPPHPMWDFAGAKPLLETGYVLTRQEIARWNYRPQPVGWLNRLRAWIQQKITVQRGFEG